MHGDHGTVCHNHLVSGHSKGLLHTYVRPVQPVDNRESDATPVP